FDRLWQLLGLDTWLREGSRLVCRLQPVPPNDRSALEIEPVADRHDIELRILIKPDGVPQLAEVVFPPNMSIAEAKAYVFEQLGEAPLCGSLRGGRWNESADAITLELNAVGGPSIDIP